jgi:hypothetical protein
VTPPPFQTRAQAIAFAAVLALALSAPLALHALGGPSRAALYASLPSEAGPMAFIHREIFVETRDVDVLFVGASHLFAGVDAPHVQRALSRALGREAVVLSFGVNWRGEDMHYVLVRDLLRRRRLHTLVLAMPRASDRESAPHPLADHWLTLDDPRVTRGLPVTQRLQVYAANVLGTPRRVLSLVRPDRLAESPPYAATLGAGLFERGFADRPFRPSSAEPPVIAARTLILSPATAHRFRFLDVPLTPYQAHFIRALVELVRERGIHLAVLSIPVWGQGPPAAHAVERLYWPEVLGVPTAVIGVPAAELFAGIDERGIEAFYYNTHLNRNGAERFTRVITPALIEAYLRPAAAAAPPRPLARAEGR